MFGRNQHWISNIVIKHGAGGLIALHNLHPAEPFALLRWHTNILLALETAIRRSEIAELRWRFIDLEKRVAHLPDTKNGNARDVPFSTKAITILSSLKEHSKQTTDKVFDMRADAITRASCKHPRKPAHSLLEIFRHTDYVLLRRSPCVKPDSPNSRSLP